MFDPFSGDQALFLVGAKVMQGGGVLYRDYWDIKQPGIFGFFWVAGTMFGFTQVGAHALELLWQTAFAVALALGMRGALRDPRWAAFAPLGVVAATYAGSSHWHLLQVEELVGFPIFLCMWAAGASARRPSANAGLALASGLAAGIVLLFKLVLAPVLVAVTVAVRLRTSEDPACGLSRFWLVWLLGMLVPATAYAVYARYTNSSGDLLEAAFAVPLYVATSVPHAPVTRLSDSAMRLLLYFRGIIILAAIGVATMRDWRTRPWRDACLAWLVAGLVVILAQAQSWWQYQFVLLVPPLGILATFGAAFLQQRVAAGRRMGPIALAASGVVAFIAVPLPQGAIGTALRVLAERPFASARALERYRVKTSTEYAGAVNDAALPLRVGSDPGAIFVFGNPLVYVIAKRAQAGAVTEWASYLDPPSIRTRLDRQLSSVRPNYVFVARDREEETVALAPEFSSILARSYSKKDHAADGTWYRKRLQP